MKLAQLLSLNGELMANEPLRWNRTMIEGEEGPKSRVASGVLGHWKIGGPGSRPVSPLPYGLTPPTNQHSMAHKARVRLESILLPVKSINLRPVQPKLESSGPDEMLQGGQTRADKLTRLLLWLLIALLAVATLACGFGMQQIAHNRQQYKLGQQLRQAEQKRRQAEFACREMHNCLVVHVAKEQQREQQMQVAQAVYSRARYKEISKR